jgi:hypothetical protein
MNDVEKNETEQGLKGTKELANGVISLALRITRGLLRKMNQPRERLDGIPQELLSAFRKDAKIRVTICNEFLMCAKTWAIMYTYGEWSRQCKIAFLLKKFKTNNLW